MVDSSLHVFYSFVFLYCLRVAANSPVTQSILPSPPQQSSPILSTAESISPASLHLLQQLQAVGLQHQILQGKITMGKNLR